MPINEFNPMFNLMFGTFMSGFTPTLVDRIDKNGRVVVNMSSKASASWNGTVWTEWKEKFPTFTEWIDDFPKGQVNVNIVNLCD